ncbi:MAG: bifunctional pyr operon transcriptional regulator/uracil phosphoribosyltransferase PyrR [Opitutae bacterium]|nr:bifunctional pyr operon transcriptional regulator/uracil phosphoribosyltransferase PyrR [Opitutae bacterium]
MRRAASQGAARLIFRRSAPADAEFFDSQLDAAAPRLQNHVLVGTRNLHDAKRIREAIESLASSIASRHRDTARLLLLGIANGGIALADRLALALKRHGVTCGRGTIDISFHRDDIGRHPIPKEFSPTLIPHDVNGATVILVDDVLYSGRTVKAALDELFDHGRPETVELAVLVDRGGRRLPMCANYCALTVEAGEGEKVIVQLDPREPSKDAVLVRAPEVAPANRKSKI